MHMRYKARFACVFRIVSGCIRYPAECYWRKKKMKLQCRCECRHIHVGQSSVQQDKAGTAAPAFWVHPSLTHPKFPVESPILLHGLCSGWVQHHHHLLVSISKDSLILQKLMLQQKKMLRPGCNGDPLQPGRRYTRSLWRSMHPRRKWNTGLVTVNFC